MRPVTEASGGSLTWIASDGPVDIRRNPAEPQGGGKRLDRIASQRWLYRQRCRPRFFDAAVVALLLVAGLVALAWKQKRTDRTRSSKAFTKNCLSAPTAHDRRRAHSFPLIFSHGASTATVLCQICCDRDIVIDIRGDKLGHIHALHIAIGMAASQVDPGKVTTGRPCAKASSDLSAPDQRMGSKMTSEAARRPDRSCDLRRIDRTVVFTSQYLDRKMRRRADYRKLPSHAGRRYR